MEATTKAERLTGTDVNELRWFFAEPPPDEITGHLAAQSYDPKGGCYDPATDLTLERMLFGAARRKPSEWKRINRILARVAEGTDGPRHVEVLRSAYDARRNVPSLDGAFEHPPVALMTQTAHAQGYALALDEERHRRLEIVQAIACREGCSPIAVAVRVLEADARTYPISHDLIRVSVLRALARAVRDTDAPTLATIAEEHDALLAAAGGAYRTSRRELQAGRREERAAAQRAKDAEWEAYVTGKRAKEAARFEERLRRVS